MARKPAAVLLLGIWMGLLGLEVVSGFSIVAASQVNKFFNGTVLDFGSAIEPAGDVDELPPNKPRPALIDIFSLILPPNSHLHLVEKDPFQRRPAMYKLQHAFLL